MCMFGLTSSREFSITVMTDDFGCKANVVAPAVTKNGVRGGPPS